jgi:branched-chain amino acid transport system ATP-binding protein
MEVADPILETRGVTVTFGGVTAVDDVSIAVERGTIVGLIGPNGAGKTTLFNVISGHLRPVRGKVVFDGRDITGRSPQSIATQGLARTFQLTSLFNGLTAIQNLVVASHTRTRPSLGRGLVTPFRDQSVHRRAIADAHGLLERMHLGEIGNMHVEELSHGHRKLLSVAMALASHPTCLLLDEPVSGMKDEEVIRTLALLSDLRAEGTSIVLVEHNVRAVIEVCDRVTVLDFGHQIAAGPPLEILHSDVVQSAYFGTQESDAKLLAGSEERLIRDGQGTPR